MNSSIISCRFSSWRHGEMVGKVSRMEPRLLLPSTSDTDHPWYNYTSGRWLYNERKRLRERRHAFNVRALLADISQAVDKSVLELRSFDKIAEGGSYRVFEAIFKNDDTKVIAKIPYPCTRPQAFGVASEVATLEFLHSKGFAVPRVLGWSATSANDAETEYILMSKVHGTELSSVWYSMTLKERLKMVERIVDVEASLFKLDLPAYGSIYHRSFLDQRPGFNYVPLDGPFCIGPSAQFMWWYKDRDKLQVERGPWSSPQEVMRSVAQRERDWLQQYGKPRFPRQPLFRAFYESKPVEPDEQIHNLELYLKVTPFIVPTGTNMARPTLRHPDLSPSNVFMSDSGDIAGLIDWQHTVVLPLSLQAKVPQHFQNYGDDDSESFRPPQLPQNYDLLSQPQQEQAAEVYRRRQLHYFYIGHTNKKNSLHFEALAKRKLVVCNKLYEAAGQPWEGENTSLKAELIRLSQSVSQSEDAVAAKMASILHFEHEEVEQCLEIEEKQSEADRQLQHIRDFIQIDEEGWIPLASYEEAKQRAEEVRLQMLEAAEDDKERMEVEQLWPFQDHDEID